MKTNYIYHFVALLLGSILLGACDQQSPREEPIDKSGTRTSMHFAVRVTTDPILRGVNQKQKDEPGTAKEQTIKQGLVLIKGLSSMPANLTEESTGIWKSALMELPAEIQSSVQMTLLLNNNSLGRLGDADFTKAREIELKDLLSYAGIEKEGMLMTTTVENQDTNNVTIDSSATATEVLQGSKNNYSFEVERVVAKVQITKSSSVTAELKDVGTLKFPLTYSMAGSAKKAYLFRDHAGSRTLSENSPNVYKDYISLIDDKTVSPEWDPKKGHPFLQRVSDKEGEAYILNGYYRNPKEVKDGGADRVSIDGGFYFLENSMYGNNKVASKKGEIKYNRIAYAKVYTKLNEIKGWKLTENGKEIERGTWNSQSKVRKYYVPVPDDWFKRMRQLHPDWWHNKLEFIFSWDGLGGNSFQIEDAPNTFYYCEDDGEIFDTARAAYIYYKGFPKNLRKYEEGRMVYLIPLNRQLDGAKGFVNYCDTRRNNIYDLNIASINSIGLNHDPVDPDDPNIPKPEDNPFEPPTDPQIPVEEGDYLMRITAKILKWNLVEKHYALWD